MQDSKFNRREVLRGALLSLGAVPWAAPNVASAAGNQKLDEKDPAAISYNYVADNSRVDVKKFPSFKKTQTCGNCIYIQGREGFWRPCTLFPGKIVFHKGWCRVWVLKTFNK